MEPTEALPSGAHRQGRPPTQSHWFSAENTGWRGPGSRGALQRCIQSTQEHGKGREGFLEEETNREATQDIRPSLDSRGWSWLCQVRKQLPQRSSDVRADTQGTVTE